jgi:hypothetical protein
MNFSAASGNPDDQVRAELLNERFAAREQEYRVRAHAAACCGKLDTARNALNRANEYAELRRKK